jgi:hypothetical protein
VSISPALGVAAEVTRPAEPKVTGVTAPSLSADEVTQVTQHSMPRLPRKPIADQCSNPGNPGNAQSEEYSTSLNVNVAADPTWCDAIEDNSGPVMATRALSYLRSALNWHATRDDEFTVPIVRGMARSSSSARAGRDERRGSAKKVGWRRHQFYSDVEALKQAAERDLRNLAKNSAAF